MSLGSRTIRCTEEARRFGSGASFEPRRVRTRSRDESAMLRGVDCWRGVFPNANPTVSVVGTPRENSSRGGSVGACVRSAPPPYDVVSEELGGACVVHQRHGTLCDRSVAQRRSHRILQWHRNQYDTVPSSDARSAVLRHGDRTWSLLRTQPQDGRAVARQRARRGKEGQRLVSAICAGCRGPQEHRTGRGDLFRCGGARRGEHRAHRALRRHVRLRARATSIPRGDAGADRRGARDAAGARRLSIFATGVFRVDRARRRCAFRWNCHAAASSSGGATPGRSCDGELYDVGRVARAVRVLYAAYGAFSRKGWESEAQARAIRTRVVAPWRYHDAPPFMTLNCGLAIMDKQATRPQSAPRHVSQCISAWTFLRALCGRVHVRRSVVYCRLIHVLSSRCTCRPSRRTA